MLLELINSPADVKKLSIAELEQLAEEIRRFIISTVGQNGGHLSSNLGTVELTLALHKAFDIPSDALIFDVGHQSYTHKILTGRKEKFSKL
ncbi:MAG: 1-deoxy-D-xylulose-5-phosphate synthase, partial [Lentisphaeria bacterium]|nr:1-deoxy-D-xylulose-5-phosphate synthase [Lentisphaeria bacterium]